MEQTPLMIVDSSEKLEEMVKLIADEPVLGIDTEADSMYAYQEKVCLVQFSDRTNDYIVDPLAGFSLEPLAPFMSDPNVVKIFHGADYDVVSMKRDFGFEFRNIFDTMISAQLLEMPKVGLADLVGHYFAVPMDKKYQTHNWAERPLYPEHLYYARGDTHFLLAIREMFVRKLKKMGRMHIAEEEFELLEERTCSPAIPPELRFMKTKGINRLDPLAQRIFRSLYLLRDRHASRMNRPPYKVMPDQVLMKLAEARPSNLDELSRHVRAKSSMVRRYGEEMVQAIAEGLATSDELPDVPKKVRSGTSARYGSREVERLFNDLKDWRKRVLKRDVVPMVLIASNTQLRAVAGYRPTSIEELSGLEEIRNWQVELYGQELLDMVAAFEEKLPSRSERSSSSAAAKKGRRRRKRRDDSDMDSDSAPQEQE
jgi:ribonuclease D